MPQQEDLGGKVDVETAALGCLPSEGPLVFWFSGGLCALSVLCVVNALAVLFLKQILKRRPRIIRTQTRRSRSLLLPGHANLKQLTLIPRVLLCDPLLHRLHALEPAPRIEIRTLLAGMQFKPALRTFLIHRHPRQHRPALRAPRHRTRPRQIQRSRTHRMVPLRWAALAFLGRLPRFLPARLTITVLISMLPVFRHNPSQTRAYCLPTAPWTARGVRRVPHFSCVLSARSGHSDVPQTQIPNTEYRVLGTEYWVLATIES
jgi:hypothetical protein